MKTKIKSKIKGKFKRYFQFHWIGTQKQKKKKKNTTPEKQIPRRAELKGSLSTSSPLKNYSSKNIEMNNGDNHCRAPPQS